ncbi:MAG: carbon-nitrogen hydrolase family protein [Mariprofundaceae bacterium]|nr:carbon-nitrogen hydrolase family protein [Mariprofundaceae bacterium]
MSSDCSECIHAAAIQLCSNRDQESNLARAAALIEKAAEKKCSLIVLPENFSFMGANEREKFDVAESRENSSVLAFLSAQARQHRAVIVGGTLPLKAGNTEKVRNSCPVFSANGELIALYDKMHLFDVDLESERHCESATVEAGEAPETAGFDGWKIGLSICYDLRFPELYRHYSSIGCNILTIPAAFTVPTGEAHWEILLRARAIENQAYVLAAGQSGTHPGGRKTWGHSMIVDPWGEVLATLHDEEGIITAELSLNKLGKIRQALPVLNHRRI